MTAIAVGAVTAIGADATTISADATAISAAAVIQPLRSASKAALSGSIDAWLTRPAMPNNGSRAGGNATGARAKARRSSRKRTSRGGRGRVARTVAGAKAVAGDGGDESVTRQLEFQPRYSPKPTIKWGGFLSYVTFLFLFLMVTIFRRNSDVYNFSEAVKGIVMTEHYQAIGADTDYFEWLSLHFLPGLAGVSYIAAPDTNFKMIGAPRIRQVRAVPCEANEDLDVDRNGWPDATTDDDPAEYQPRKVVPACWENDEVTGSTQSFGGPNGARFTYQDATELGERSHYNSEGGLTYPGGGFVVPVDMLKRLMTGATGRAEEAATVEMPVTEFYGFSYTGFNVSELQDSGWWDARTTAIFHDFTVAASNGMYCHCRLVLTVGINHGLIHKSIEMRMVWLESFPDQNVVLDIVFFVYVIFLIFNEFAEFWQFYKSPNQNLLEQMTEKRYRLRQRLLQYAAFHGIAKYDPHPHMERLMRRLHVKYQDTAESPPSKRHIENLNKIGLDMVRVHEDWKGMVEVGSKKVDFRLNELDDKQRPVVDATGQKQAALAVIDLFDKVQELHDDHLKIKAMERLAIAQLGLLSPAQLRLRVPIATRLFFAEGWNFMDFINYMLFMIAMLLRVQSLQLVEGIQSEIGDLNSDTMHMKYINFSEMGERDRLQYNINAFNAVLTWIKLFKYLDFYPPMLTLINTLSRAAKMLWSLMVTIGIVLLGSGQGFFMAFGLEVHMYRDFGGSVMGLLRMSVGDFDYTELASSNRTLGPLMFWLYIVLVFFVLMSMFIALVSEAFEEAKEAQQNRSYTVRGLYNQLRTEKLLEEAGSRWRFSAPENMGIISRKMHRDLGDFSDRPSKDESEAPTALTLFIKHQREIDKLASGGGGTKELSAGRRSSLATLPVNGAQLAHTGGACWDRTWIGRKLRSRLYWVTGADIISTAGGKREVAGWFKQIEAKRKGMEYISKKHYQARDPRELSFAKGEKIIVTEQPPGGHKHPITGKRKEGVWKGYVYKHGPATVKIVYGFDQPDEEGRFSKGGFLQEVERKETRLAEAVDLSDSEEDELPSDELAGTGAARLEQDETEDEAEAEDETELAEDVYGDSKGDDDRADSDGDGNHNGITTGGKQGKGDGVAPLAVRSKSANKQSRESDYQLSMAQPHPAYSATESSGGKSFGETRQHQQSRKEQEMDRLLSMKEKAMVEQDKELKRLKAENERLKLERRPQSAASTGMGSAKLEERIAEIAESLDAIVPAAIAASTAALRDELSEIKDLLLGDAGQQRQQLQQSTDDADGGAAGRGGALSSDRTLANRKDGKWVKMAALGDDTVYGDAEEYWHHTGTNAIRKSPPAGVQLYSETGEPLEIDGAAMRWDDDESIIGSMNDGGGMLADASYPGQIMDPVRQSRDREKQRRQGQEMERLRKGGEPRYAYGARSTPVRMALDSGLSKPEQLHITASKIAGGTIR